MKKEMSCHPQGQGLHRRPWLRKSQTQKGEFTKSSPSPTQEGDHRGVSLSRNTSWDQGLPPHVSVLLGPIHPCLYIEGFIWVLFRVPD